MFDSPNTIHLSIGTLRKLLAQAESIQKDNPERFESGRLSITKTAWRQTSLDEDTIEITMLDKVTIPENVEG